MIKQLEVDQFGYTNHLNLFSHFNSFKLRQELNDE